MKRIGSIVMVLGVTLLTTGCSNEKTDKPGSPATQQQQKPATPNTAQHPATPATGQQPAVDPAAKAGGGKVAGAVGRALLKGIAGPSKPEDSGEAPKYEP